MVLGDFVDFFIAQIQSTFITIQPENLLGELYLVLNFFLLLFAEVFSGNGGGGLF